MTISGFSDLGPSMAECVHTGIILVDACFRVLNINWVAKKLFSIEISECSKGVTCHFLLQQQKNPCPECPIIAPESASSTYRSLSLKRRGEQDRFLKEYSSPWGENYMLTFIDVTREIMTLRKTDLARKELHAKNILVERHRREATEEKMQLVRLLDQLPEALVSVKNAYQIERKNRVASLCFPNSNAGTCFGLFGKVEPCPGCPAGEGFENVNGRKTNHFIGGTYFTEEVIKLPDDNGGLLLFRDTTRQIQLIGKIREQQDTITRNNEILSSLVRFQAMTQTERDSAKVVDFFLDVFTSVSKNTAISIIVNDIRPASLWFTVQRGMSDYRLAMLTRVCLSIRNGGGRTEAFLNNDESEGRLREIDIRGGDGRRVGFAFIENTADEDEDDEDHIKLFFEPLGAYIHNRLLMRQLEERANTDTLTGLYNRSYFETVFSEERKKFQDYNIPFSVVAADVNRLKQANDEYGHETGDRLIMAVAQRLKSSLREMDCVARTGGDEFMILLANTPHDAAQQAVLRFSKTLFQDVTIDLGEGKRFPVTVSFGAAGIDVVNPENLLNDADRRMYEAKKAFYEKHDRYR